MIRAICSLIAIASTVSCQSTSSTPISPCPDVFTYEPSGSGEKPLPGATKWYGTVTLNTDITLYALYLNIIVDSKADILGNWVGEVTTEDNLNFKIENSKMKISPGSPLAVRFFIQYNSQYNAPKLQSILFNGREICKVERVQNVRETSTVNYYDFNNGIPGRGDITTTTSRPSSVTKAQNQFGQTKATGTQTRTDKNQTKSEPAKTTNVWTWVPVKTDNQQQNKSNNNQQTGSSVTQNANRAQDTRQQTTSQTWSQTKPSNYQQPTKSEKLQVAPERNIQATFGSSTYTKPAQTYTKSENNQENKQQSWSQTKVDNNRQGNTENRESSQSNYGTSQAVTQNIYNKGQSWQSTREENQQTKPTNTQTRYDERFQGSTGQSYSQSNRETNQYTTQKNTPNSFIDSSYAQVQNSQQRKPGGVSNSEQYDLQKKVATDSFQVTGNRQQARPVDALPIRDDGIVQSASTKRKGDNTSRAPDTYSYLQDQRQTVEYVASRPSNDRGGVSDRNVQQQTGFEGHQSTTGGTISRPIVSPIVDSYYSDNPTQEEFSEEPEVELGLPIYIPNFRPENACGKVTKKRPQTLAYGSTTSEGQWPWQAAIYQQQTVDFKYICGGTLVSYRHIITAAHCVTRRNSRREVNQNTLTVYLGKFNLRTSVDGVQVKFVKKIIIHPEYNATLLNRDVAILKLRDAVEFTDWVRPACLWPEDKIGRRNIVGKKGSVVGWGFEMNGAPRTELSLLEMPVVDQETCIRSFSSFYQKFTSEYTYCAGYSNGASVCNGDSGGGMVFKRGNTWYLRGLVSLSLARPNERCDPNGFVIFTDLAKLLPWIEEHTD